MCLAVPGEILDVTDGALRMGRVSFGGIVKEICLAYVPEAQPGAYVLVHAGFAIATVSEAHALDVLALLGRAEHDA
jgi:hydrogenase expression/formation protein HypC